MVTEKRLIRAVDMKTSFREWLENEDFRTINQMIDDVPTVDAVEAVQFNTLKSLVNGEWVDCKLVQEALGIDFGTGLKMFDFSRTVEWNPAPLNGQKTTTKFRLKNTEVHGRWVSTEEKPHLIYKCSECGDKWSYGAMLHCNYCPNCGANMDGDGND